MFNIKQYQKNTEQLSSLIPWVGLVAPSVILNKDGSLQKSFKFRGPDLGYRSDQEIIAIHAQLNNALKRLKPKWAIYVEMQRRNFQYIVEKSYFSNLASLAVETERVSAFSENNLLFENHCYLTLQYLPTVETNKKKEALHLEKSINAFIEETEQVSKLLSDVMLEMQALNDNETLTYLHSCISNKPHHIKTPEIPMYLDSLLTDTPLIAGSKPRIGEKHLRCISLLGFPATSFPDILSALNHLPFTFRWSTRFIPLDQLDAEKQLKAYKRRWFTKRKSLLHLLQEIFSKTETAMLDSSAIEKSTDADEALQILANNAVSFGYYTTTIVLRHEEQKVVEAQCQDIIHTINQLGFTTIKESINTVEAWLAAIPGHAYANIRRPLIHSLNLAHLIPFSSNWAGQIRNAHLNAPPLCYLHTASNTPFRLVNHIDDVGHQMIIGPTGAGKSVLLNFIALQFCRYQNAQVFIFDKGGSFLNSTLCVDGDYHSLENNKLQCQPLRDIENDAEKSWALQWLQELIINTETPQKTRDKKNIWQALNELSHFPKIQRTMSAFCKLLQDHRLREIFTAYTSTGSLGRIFDTESRFQTNSHWQCYELESLMDSPRLIRPTLSYLFHQLEKQFVGHASLLILDEAWLFLDHPIFADKIRSWLKSLRKSNVSVIFATQSIEDVLSNHTAATLLESCPSRVFLPNARALEPQISHAYKQLGLNEKQISIISTAKAKQQYYYQSSIGNRLFELQLGKASKIFCTKTSIKDQQEIKELHKRYGKYLLKHLLEQAGYNWILEHER